MEAHKTIQGGLRFNEHHLTRPTVDYGFSAVGFRLKGAIKNHVHFIIASLASFRILHFRLLWYTVAQAGLQNTFLPFFAVIQKIEPHCLQTLETSRLSFMLIFSLNPTQSTYNLVTRFVQATRRLKIDFRRTFFSSLRPSIRIPHISGVKEGHLPGRWSRSYPSGRPSKHRA